MRLTTLTFAAGFALTSVAFAETVAPADVQIGEDGAVAQSLTGVAGDPAKGREIIITKSKGNCIACHAAKAWEDAPFAGEVGPVLDGVGDRWTPEQLRGILVNSKNVFEGTVMPAYYKIDGFNRPAVAFTSKAPEGPLDPLLAAQDIEDVVAFLSTLKD